MARINIEDTLDDDPRFHLLQKMVGRQLAYGVWRDVAKLAQNYWKSNQSPIPEKVFKYIENSQAMIDSGMCEIAAGGVKLIGSEDAFDWLVTKQEAGAKGGKKSAKRPRDEKGRLLPKQSPSKTQAEPSKSKPPTPSPTLSPSLTLKEKGSRKPDPDEDGKAKALRSQAWLAYRNAYVLKYGIDPTRDAKANTHIKQICSRAGQGAPALLEFFLATDKPFYVEKAHELGLCVSDCQALMVGMKTGSMPTAARASPSNADRRTAHNKSIHDKYDEIERSLSEQGSSDSEAS